MLRAIFFSLFLVPGERTGVGAPGFPPSQLLTKSEVIPVLEMGVTEYEGGGEEKTRKNDVNPQPENWNKEQHALFTAVILLHLHLG